MSKGKLKSKSVMTREDLTTYLETLVAGLKQGTLILDSEEAPMVLRPSDSIEAELEIKQKPDKEKLELCLTWKPGQIQPLGAAALQTNLTSDPNGDEGKKK